MHTGMHVSAQRIYYTHRYNRVYVHRHVQTTGRRKHTIITIVDNTYNEHTD